MLAQQKNITPKEMRNYKSKLISQLKGLTIKENKLKGCLHTPR